MKADSLKHLRVVSFDMEGTLIDHSFSEHIWGTDIPNRYAEKHGLDLETARGRVFAEYDSIGDERPEWYDVGYWFSKLGLPGDWRELPERRRDLITLYPETREVLDELSGRYPLVVTSNTIRAFLDVQVQEVGDYFAHVFSAPSDYHSVKKDHEFYRRIIDTLGVKPGEVAHVGDHRRYDYLASKGLGVKAFHLDRADEKTGEDTVRNLKEFSLRLQQP
ncbi:HAD family hydrolase [Candidatus Bathyarchaeota archaeon]|nr:HAD family hydrolase [Candidatus Bathyarchaeota archaeon]